MNETTTKLVKPGLIISIIALVVAISGTFASIYFSAINLKTDVMPTLVFVYDNTDCWAIRNVGNGPALNLEMAQQPGSVELWEQPTRMYPLAQGGKTDIPWVGRSPEKLTVVYDDVHGQKYTSTAGKDVTKIKEAKAVPAWGHSEPEWQRRITCAALESGCCLKGG